MIKYLKENNFEEEVKKISPEHFVQYSEIIDKQSKNSDNSTFSKTWLSNTENLLQNKKL